MASPQEYNNKIMELGVNNWEINISSIPEAQNVLSQIRRFQSDLWELKRGIKAEINVVWEKYREESKETSNIGAGDVFLAAMFGKRTAYKVRKQTREQRANNRDQMITAYREVESRIDDLLNQLNALKERVQNFIAELKAEAKKNQQHSIKQLAQQAKPESYYYEYINSQEWRKKAEEAKARAGNRCQVCNRSRAEVQIDAHHRTYERLGRELPEDITVLCRDCHQLYEDAKKTLPVPLPATPESGFCIRCKKPIELNPQSPYCYSCFKVWKKFGNPDYKEQYCHFCGKEHRSTRLKPACYECYKEYRNQVQFQKNSIS